MYGKRTGACRNGLRYKEWGHWTGLTGRWARSHLLPCAVSSGTRRDTQGRKIKHRHVSQSLFILNSTWSTSSQKIPWILFSFEQCNAVDSYGFRLVIIDSKWQTLENILKRFLLYDLCHGFIWIPFGHYRFHLVIIGSTWSSKVLLGHRRFHLVIMDPI